VNTAIKMEAILDWIDVCKLDDLQTNSGICALVNGQQLAIFYLPSENALYAIDNFDPIGKANVLSRGIVGDIDGQIVVASPLYKQHFNLQSGVCLENDQTNVKTYPVRLNGTIVQVSC